MFKRTHDIQVILLSSLYSTSVSFTYICKVRTFIDFVLCSFVQMRLLPMSFVFNRKLQPQTFNSSNNEMLASNPYALELPYLGTIFLGKSPPNLTSFQKPLREMYLSYGHEYSHEQRRILISDSDILIFESENAQRSKRSFTYAKLESIVNIQILKFSLMRRHNPKQHLQVAFLPLGKFFLR